MKKVFFDQAKITAELRFTVCVEIKDRFDDYSNQLTVVIPVGSAEELANLLTCYTNKDYSDLFSNESFYVDDIQEVYFEGLTLRGACEELSTNLFIIHRLHGSAQINTKKVVGESAEKLSKIKEIINS